MLALSLIRQLKLRQLKVRGSQAKKKWWFYYSNYKQIAMESTKRKALTLNVIGSDG